MSIQLSQNMLLSMVLATNMVDDVITYPLEKKATENNINKEDRQDENSDKHKDNKKNKKIITNPQPI